MSTPLTVSPWKDAVVRASGIGSSEAAAAIGEDPWKSQLQLYLEKIGIISPEDVTSEPAYWGNVLEPVILQEYATRHDCEVLGRDRGGDPYLFRPRDNDSLPAMDPMYERLMGTLRHPTRVWQFAHADGFVLDRDGTPTGGLEAKAPGYWRGRDFGDEGTDHVPLEFLSQVYHQADIVRAVVAPLPWTLVALIGGQRWQEFPIPIDDILRATIAKMEDDFWDRVERRDPPAPEATEAGRKALALLYPNDNGQAETVTPGHTLYPLAVTLRDARQAKKDAETAELAAALEVQQQMGDTAKLVNADGKTLIRWTQNKDSERVDWNSVATVFAREYEIPDEKQHEIIGLHTNIKPGPRVFDARWIHKLDTEDDHGE